MSCFRWQRVPRRKSYQKGDGEARRGTNLNAGARGDLVEQIFEDRLKRYEGLSNGDSWRESIPGRGSRKCKGPEVRFCLASVRMTRRPARLGTMSEGSPGKVTAGTRGEIMQSLAHRWKDLSFSLG